MKHNEFIQAIRDKDYKKARELSVNSYKADNQKLSEIDRQLSGLEQTQVDAIYNYFRGRKTACLEAIPKELSRSSNENSVSKDR